MKIKKLLIANRGEIAARITRTCKKLGIATVAVFSEADRNSPYVKLADERFFIGEPPASESYLNIPKLIEACKLTEADAVHPGYGFLSEHPGFAKALKEAGINFVGPEPESISLMGDKIESRLAMQKAGIPVVPGYDGSNQDPQVLLAEAKKIGFPVMVKASAGGGGKGMRRVDREEDFMESLTSAKREAKNFFANDTVFLEKFVTRPRHIEFQVFGDKHGNAVHLFERDCSVQRRHQKIIEECPAFHFSSDLRKKMGEVAVNAARSIGYVGAGTVEFILSETGEFYFMEMNTRLQVEHPVTEMVTGLDLVELQIRVAEGEKLADLVDTSKLNPNLRHSIEVRIYAEDPENKFLPSTGVIHSYKLPEGEGVRNDTGVEEKSEVTIFYDPMIAKLIVTAENREKCIDNLISALDNYVILGPTTNISYLKTVLSHPNFKAGKLTTYFLEENIPAFSSNILIHEAVCYAKLVSSLRQKTEAVWDALSGFVFWNNETNFHSNGAYFILPDSLSEPESFSFAGTIYTVSGRIESNFIHFIIQTGKEKISAKIPLFVKGTSSSIETTDSAKINYFRYGNQLYLHFEGNAVKLTINSKDLSGSAGNQNTLSSPMPGKIIQINVKPGDSVKAGSTLVIVEAMKMENALKASVDCEVEEVSFKEGDLVRPEDVIVRVKGKI